MSCDMELVLAYVFGPCAWCLWVGQMRPKTRFQILKKVYAKDIVLIAQNPARRPCCMLGLGGVLVRVCHHRGHEMVPKS